MKKVIGFLVVLFFLPFFVYISTLAAEDGEALFKSKCGSCHKTGGEGPLFSPVKFASSQWERFFAKNKHERKKDISDVVSAGEADAILKYLSSHAADSDLPIAAGLK